MEGTDALNCLPMGWVGGTISEQEPIGRGGHGGRGGRRGGRGGFGGEPREAIQINSGITAEALGISLFRGGEVMEVCEGHIFSGLTFPYNSVMS